MSKKIIYKYIHDCENCFVSNQYRTLTITSVVYEHKFLWFKWYTITQNIPYLDDPYYDVEYGTNHYLSSKANECKTKCEKYIDEVKNKRSYL